jgi:serine/threonine protein kinase HipA of HipAB toxin-antitoxin module
MAHGHDAVGNLLLGERARDQFLHSPVPEPIAQAQKGEVYARLAEAAARGEQPGSSAGGEQPKFTAFADTPAGPRHVLVKFSLPDGGAANATIQRWRDLLLAEHNALQTLAASGIPAAPTDVVDHVGQRFLEVERFDRVGTLGRRGVFSLAALEAEFVGDAPAPWPSLVARLADAGHTDRASVQGAGLLYAFGTLIGNTDMHHGNLSFTSVRGRPYTLAPAYDMLPMGFAPRASGALPAQLPPVHLHACVDNATWRQAWDLAKRFMARIQAEPRFSADFAHCLAGLARHLDDAQAKLARLG